MSPHRFDSLLRSKTNQWGQINPQIVSQEKTVKNCDFPLDKGNLIRYTYVCRWKKVEESGMFYGEYQHSLDRKGRLVFPSKFRQVSQENYIERFYITRGLDKCLFVFTEEEWKLQEQQFKSLPFTKAEARRFNRLYFSGACEIILDKQGRVLIPKYLKDYAGIERQVVIVGVSNRIEIWSANSWKDFYEKTQGSFEDIAEKLIE